MNTNNVNYRIKLLDALKTAKDLCGKALVLYSFNSKYNLQEKQDFIPQHGMRDITEVSYENGFFQVGYRKDESSDVQVSHLTTTTSKVNILGTLRDGTHVV